MEKKYFITRDQFETIQHYKRMFELNAELINGLCSTERDDIVYGFELGKIYTHMRDCFMEMMELDNEISKQTLDSKSKTDLVSIIAEKNRVIDEINELVDETKYGNGSNEFKIWQIINNSK